MQMKMKDGLSRAAAIVENGAIAGEQIAFLGEFRCNQLQFPEHRLIFRGGIVQRGKMFSRADQNVRRSLRVDIFKRKHLFIFINEFRRNLLRGDFAEQTIRVHHFTPEGAASSNRTTQTA